MKLIATASIIYLVLCVASIAESRQKILIPAYKVSINYANIEDTELVSNGIKKAYLFVTTHPYQHRFDPKRPFEWRLTDYILCLP